MYNSAPTIDIAFDEVTKRNVTSKELFKVTQDSFNVRRMYHEKKIIPKCCECGQDLTISTSKLDRIHFKHKPGHSECMLGSSKLSVSDRKEFTKILVMKESDRHKELKNRIGRLLEKTVGVDKDSLAVDNQFIIRGDEKRKPDVYSKYFDKELVFEIQLSKLPLSYILNRYEFYRNNGIYLIWILDNFDIHNQGTLEKDIKYLAQHQNFFKLDEKANSFSLECDYKYPFLTQENKLLSKWKRKSLALGQLKFDDESLQIYYYNFEENCQKKEVLQNKKAKQLEREYAEKVEKERLDNARHRAKRIISNIRKHKDGESQNFLDIWNEISELDEYELRILNDKLNLKPELGPSKRALLTWIKTAGSQNMAFLRFILFTDDIELDLKEVDDYGKSALQLVYENDDIWTYDLAKRLFERGYSLTQGDIDYLKKREEAGKSYDFDIEIYQLMERLEDRYLSKSAFDHRKLLFVIESARRNKIVGFNYQPTAWIAFANNAIHQYSAYWKYIELSFKETGLWDTLIQLDKKGTFINKVNKLRNDMPEQKSDFDGVFMDLYPDFHYKLNLDYMG